MKCVFTAKNGEVLEGEIIYWYNAFEGGMRYIFKTDTGKEYRCIREETENGFRYKEYVAQIK